MSVHVQELDSYRNVTNLEDFYTVNLQVSRVTRNSQGNKASVPYTENTVKMTKEELRKGKWLKINVTNMVAEFFRLPREYLSVIVRVQDSKGRMNLVVPHPSSETNNALVSSIIFLCS